MWSRNSCGIDVGILVGSGVGNDFGIGLATLVGSGVGPNVDRGLGTTAHWCRITGEQWCCASCRVRSRYICGIGIRAFVGSGVRLDFGHGIDAAAASAS